MMTGLVKELCLQFFLLVNLYHALEATWHETVDTNGETKIYHTIPRIKRVQDLQQNAPMNIDRSSLPYDDYPVRYVSFLYKNTYIFSKNYPYLYFSFT